MGKNIENEQLLRIARYLMLNTSFFHDNSLSHGKMGIAIFFFHYGQYSNSSIYTDYAWDLIEDIYEKMHYKIPVNFENGLCGIGFGIEYLVQNKFMKGNTGDILEDLNNLVMERDPRRIKDISFEKGLGGIYYYVFMHTNSPYCSSTVFDSIYLKELNQAVNTSEISSLVSKGYPCFDFSSPLTFPSYLLSDEFELNKDTDITKYAFGIKNGLAGIGLKLIGI